MLRTVNHYSKTLFNPKDITGLLAVVIPLVLLAGGIPRISFNGDFSKTAGHDLISPDYGNLVGTIRKYLSSKSISQSTWPQPWAFYSQFSAVFSRTLSSLSTRPVPFDRFGLLLLFGRLQLEGR